MKKVLMITYFYPPSCAAGTFRSLRFSKYLINEGWKPVILTIKENKIDLVDSNLLKKIPSSIEIFRTPAFLFYKTYEKIVKASAQFISRFLGVKKKNSDLIDCVDIKKLEINRDNKQMSYRYLLGHILRTPDDAVGWVPFAFIAGLFLIYKKDIDLIYASGSPFSSFVTGLWLKKISGRPLVVDFRDPWATNDLHLGPPVFKKISRCLEKKVVWEADVLITNTEEVKRQIATTYEGSDKEKIVVITNGFDDEDFQNIETVQHDKFTVAYLGSTNFSHNPSPFFWALRELLDNHEEYEEKLQVIFVGTGFNKYIDLVKTLGLEKIVIWKDQLEHSKALNIMASCHLLLLLQTGSVAELSCIPGKIFEYIATKKPILAITGDGILKDFFLNKNVCGEVYSPDSIPEIKEALKRFYAQYESGGMKSQPNELLEEYRSQNLTKLLAETLNSAKERVTCSV